jgi:hypothetical protein
MIIHLTCILFILWASPVFAQRALYALECPEIDGLISQRRLKWERAGFRFDINQRPTEEELELLMANIGQFSQFHVGRLRRAYSSVEKITDFRPGIQLQHDTFNVPREVEGCQTVVVAARSPEWSTYLGDLDAWNRLPSIDRLLLQLHPDFLEYNEGTVLFSPTLSSLSLRGFEVAIKASGIGYGPRLSYAGAHELDNCTWYDEHYPKQCRSSDPSEIKVGSTTGILDKFGGTVEFHRAAGLHKANFEILRFFDNGKLYTCSGDAILQIDGTPAWCEGFVKDGNGTIRLHWGGTHLFQIGPYEAHAFTNVVYDERGRPQYGVFLQNVRAEGGRGRNFTPSGYHMYDKPVVAFHTNGKFKSGILQAYDGGNFYIECDSNGRIIKKLDMTWDVPHEIQNKVHHLKSGDEELVLNLAKTSWDFKVKFSKIETTYQSTPSCTPKVDDKLLLRLPPNCEAVVHAFTIIQVRTYGVYP